MDPAGALGVDMELVAPRDLRARYLQRRMRFGAATGFSRGLFADGSHVGFNRSFSAERPEDEAEFVVRPTRRAYRRGER